MLDLYGLRLLQVRLTGSGTKEPTLASRVVERAVPVVAAPVVTDPLWPTSHDPTSIAGAGCSVCRNRDFVTLAYRVEPQLGLK